MNDVLAIELGPLTVKAALVHDGDATRQMRELIGTASVEDQLDAVKRWSVWFGAPRVMPAVVIVDDLVDYKTGRVVPRGPSDVVWSANRMSEWLARPVSIAARTDVLSVAPTMRQLPGTDGATRTLFVRLAPRPQVTVVDDGAILSSATPLISAGHLRSSDPIEAVSAWTPLVDLALAERSEAIVLADGTADQREGTREVIEALLRQRAWSGRPPVVTVAHFGRHAALEAASMWPAQIATGTRTRLIRSRGAAPNLVGQYSST